MKVTSVALRPAQIADETPAQTTPDQEAAVFQAPADWNRKYAARPRGQSEDAAYWRKLERLQGNGPARATHVENLRHGPTAWKRRLETIDNAKQSVVITTYILEADSHGIELLEHLIARAEAGVSVFLAMDFMGTRTQSLAATPQARAQMDFLLAKLKHVGGEITWYAPPMDQLSKFGQGTHYKSLLVDGTTAIVGGRNMATKYFDEWTDFELVLKGPIVAKIANESLEILEHARTGTTSDFNERLRYGQKLSRLGLQLDAAAQHEAPPSASDISFQIVAFDPNNEKGENRVTRALVETFKRAKKEILVSSNFVNGVAEIQEALIGAAKRGVKITVVTAGQQRSLFANLPYINAEIAARMMHASGINVRETTTFEHGKMYVVDGKIGAFGSYNLEHPANGRLAEVLLFTADPTTVQALRTQILDTANNRATPYDPTPKKRVGGFLQRFFARLVQPFV